MTYSATKASLDAHEVPAWFDDAKLGIFIHWGLYSVPAYAPTEYGDTQETFSRGARFHFAHNPYAEWYLNSLKLEDGPYPAYHRATFGEETAYGDFASTFNAEIQAWDPAEMANIFAATGAQYVVSACQQCTRTLAEAARRKKIRVRTMDIAEILARLLK